MTVLLHFLSISTPVVDAFVFFQLKMVPNFRLISQKLRFKLIVTMFHSSAPLKKRFHLREIKLNHQGSWKFVQVEFGKHPNVLIEEKSVEFKFNEEIFTNLLLYTMNNFLLKLLNQMPTDRK